MNKILYITFYTEGYYEEIFNRFLRPSLEKFELQFKAIIRPNSHDWLKNGKYKTQLILDVLKSTNDDIVFLDADAQIVKTPDLFYNIPEEYNLAVHALDWYSFWHDNENQPKREIVTSTIYFRNNTETIQFVEEWNKLNQESSEWGQRILQKLLEQNKIKYYNLPFEYCRILKVGEAIPDNAVIVQHQASRQGRSKT
jgi:hypothetical protein